VPPVAPPKKEKAPGRHSTTVLIVAVLIAGLLGGVAGGTVAYLTTDETASGSPSSSSGSSSSSGTPPLAERPPESVAGISERVLPSTVYIVVEGAAQSGSGSGVVLDKDGNILTNNHVVEPSLSGGSLQAQLPDGTVGTARVVGRVPSMDLAVIRIEADPDSLVPAQVGDSDALVVGDPVIAVGAPLGLTGSVTAGIVSALDRPVTVGGTQEQAIFSAIQTDAAINPGNSGGPLANGNGEIVGINSAIATLGGGILGQSSGSIGVGFSIPMSQASRIAQELIATGSATRATLGVTVDVSQETGGAQVQTVESGSPADGAGLRRGDVIVEFGGVPIANGISLIAQVRASEPGETVELVYRRGSATETVTVTLGTASAE
jgi:putative serine protease PepD